jgi:RNA polymerase sigma factor FliA
MQPPDSQEDELWWRYRRGDDSTARVQLFETYSPWATTIASGLFRQYKNRMVEREDYIQNAKVGLLEAMSRYDPEQGVPFRVYAQPRVRGAVLNGLRVLRQAQATSSADFDIGEVIDFLPESSEDDPVGGVTDAVSNACIGFLLQSAYRVGVDREDGFAYAKNRQIETRIMAAVGLLPDRLKTLILDHYFRHIPFHEIADRCGLTKGRISQMHHDALMKVRCSLRDFSDEH